jgi:hypothetical protein
LSYCWKIWILGKNLHVDDSGVQKPKSQPSSKKVWFLLLNYKSLLYLLLIHPIVFVILLKNLHIRKEFACWWQWCSRAEKPTFCKKVWFLLLNYKSLLYLLLTHPIFFVIFWKICILGNNLHVDDSGVQEPKSQPSGKRVWLLLLN